MATNSTAATIRNCFHRHALRQLVAQPDCRNVRQQHAERGAEDHLDRRLEVRGQGYGRKLRFVSHFGDEECDHRGDEGACPDAV